MRFSVGLALALVLAGVRPARVEVSPSTIDAVFARYSATTPGCAVGVERAGQPAMLRAYGSSDLEHGVPNRVESVFEAGSVSKQFTAAAVLLLARDGRLTLHDDVRKFIPELPDYGRPITIDELLAHTSGLRDWGDVEAIGGWPRGDRVYSMQDVLNVAARQKALNYAPGTAWSYTNTGYNLLAIVVERVSGKPFPVFTRERLFAPLGMTHSGWRDDFRKIVPGRAIAYGRSPSGYEQQMPFENAFGNGGLLSTVGDLLIWNRAIGQGALGPFVTAELQRRSTLNDGRALDYGRGVFIQRYKGFREVAHSGATAAYRAWLGRYPDQGLSIALLCNAGDATPGRFAHAVADLYLTRSAPPLAEPPRVALAPWAGLYANDRDGETLRLSWRGDRLRSDRGLTVASAPEGGLRLGDAPVTLLPDGRFQLGDAGDAVTYRRVGAYAPSRADLERVVGRYQSAEARAAFLVSLQGDALRMTIEDRTEDSVLLRPVYPDAFHVRDGMVRLVRAKGGAVTGLRLSDDRVWDLRATRAG